MIYNLRDEFVPRTSTTQQGWGEFWPLLLYLLFCGSKIIRNFSRKHTYLPCMLWKFLIIWRLLILILPPCQSIAGDDYFQLCLPTYTPLTRHRDRVCKELAITCPNHCYPMGQPYFGIRNETVDLKTYQGDKDASKIMMEKLRVSLWYSKNVVYLFHFSR